MRLSSSYLSIPAAKALPYFTKTDLRRGRDPRLRDWEDSGLHETFVYKNNRYSFAGETRQDPDSGQHVFLYESGQDRIWVNRDGKIRNITHSSSP